MTIMQNVRRVLDSTVQHYNAPKEWNIYGVKVLCKSDNSNADEEWKTALETWLPKFDEVGWLEGFHGIYIEEDMNTEGTMARYNHNGTIDADLHPNLEYEAYRRVDEDIRSAVLVHEFVHHAHNTFNEFENWHRPIEEPEQMEIAVNNYASKNVGEAIAEIGVGIVDGRDFPHWVHEYYAHYDGPQEVYDIG